ncbi:unnamed protein product (macronuclear) [Paramecium tetraurelia]|uniref:NACHT domain-containing protein n=1 Tax=Paramecium tetraurelia TaxID=5888 RepID=A0D137_PARTE|nr:uncharacterized protein GSPATT00039169001 [Paramecium tetraurelia]CAK76754.1 unnamed protein product [Paramecium tetraurelia]|eukprot:XP_001444151.1 hypothetical protein (macronuclear) [Paramecium tetraurelia strain d4-2]
MLSQISQMESILRGGGCGTSKINPLQSEISKSDNQDLYNFFNKFNFYVEIICTKAVVAADQSENQEIMIALQWFSFQEENIYKLNKNAQSVMKSYDLILEGIRKLLKSCLIQIKQIRLNTTASLSKVIFSFHILNEERFMKCDQQQEFFDISDKLRKHMEIEKNDLIQNQMELYLFLTRTSFEISPNNSNERVEILKGCLSGIIGSIIQMKPNEELLESLFQGACHLYKLYIVSNNRKQFEVYFQIDMLQWEIISYFKDEKLKNIDKILLQVEEIHNIVIKNSNLWKYHYLWVQMIGKILQYNPLLTKQKLSQLINSFKFGLKPDQIWTEYQRKGLLIQMNHRNDQAVIQLNQLQNTQLSQIDRKILETCFKEWEIFLLFKDFLVNDQYQNIPFTFRSYLKSKLNIEVQTNEIIFAINKINNFLAIMISSKLLTLTIQNVEKVEEQFYERKAQQQIKKMIQNLEEYFQNLQDIIKIMSLNSRKLQERNENSNFEKLQKLSSLQELLELSIFREERDQNVNDENDSIYEWRIFIFEDLKELDFKEYKFSFHELPYQNKSKILEEAQKLIKIIQKEFYELEITELQNNLLQYFQHLCKEISNTFQEFNLHLKEIMIIMYQIEAVPKIDELQKIKKSFANKQLFKFLENIRYKSLKLKLKLISLKKSFLLILEQAKAEELRKLSEVINLDEFLFSVIEDFPKRILIENFHVTTLLTELQNNVITDIDIEQRLSRQKGIIKFILSKQYINEKLVEEEGKDLELIEKEFGELFIKEPPSFPILEEIIAIYEDLKVDEQLGDDKFRLPEKEKYDYFLSQLRQIENLNKCQSIVNLNSLIVQTELVIKTIQTFGQTDKEIDKMLIYQELLIFKSIMCKISKEEQQQVSKSQDKVSLERVEISVKENYRTYLQFMIKIIKLKTLKLQEGRELLNQLFEKVVLFSEKLDQIQRYEKENQIKFQKRCQECIQEFMEMFEESQLILNQANQNDDENFHLYLERIETQFFKRGNDKVIAQDQIKISDFLYQLVVSVQKQLAELKYRSNMTLKQDFLIQQIKKIYLEENGEEDQEESKEQFCLLDNFVQRVKEFSNNDQWKIKQGLVFTIIQISSNCFSDSMTSFCQKVLIQLWVQEKDQRVRNILKNQGLISVQMQILQKDWSTQHDRIANNMQEMLRQIDELQEQISHEANLNKRDIYLKELDEQRRNQINKLKISVKWVNSLDQQLTLVEGKINKMKEQLKSIGNDVKFLRGKSVEQLFEIRKWKVLKEAALRNVKSIYVPLQTKEIFHKTENGKKREDKLKQLNDKEGEVNEFLLDEKETVLLIHGVAGSGKSTTAKKIEELIWKLHNDNKKVRNQILIPIYISLSSLKNPVFQAVEEALHQDEYGFDELQLRECKEMLEKKEFRLLLIMDSYDEMKLENIQKNLYMNNKVKQNWSDPLVIFTTRSEIFTSSYVFWFAPDQMENLKEIQLQKFNSDQIIEYLKKFTIQSVKMLIFEIFEWQTQISNQGGLGINNFEKSWEKLKESCLSTTNFNGEALMNQKQIENILSFLKNNQSFALKSKEALRSLMVKLQKLWSVEKYKKMMEKISIYRLIGTPYMMEIIVQVLPKMMMKASDMINLRQNFLKNFPIMLYEFYKSNYLIRMYKWQQKQVMGQNKNEEEQENKQQENNEKEQQDKNEKEQQGKNEKEQQDKNEKEQQDNNEKEQQDNNVKEQQVTQTDVENFGQNQLFEIGVKVWNKMEEDSIATQFFNLKELNDLNNNKNLLFEHYFKLFNNEFAIIQKDRLIEVVCNALRELNLTSYDFYDEFINEYHNQQIEKQRNLGKSIHIDRFLHDLKKYSINLAKVMSTKQMTQVKYQQQGFLYQEEKEEEKWQNDYFNDDDHQFGSYKKDLRSCSLVQQKGTNFQFVHKSIQEFYIAADLYSVLVVSKELNKQTFVWILEQLSIKNNCDKNCFEYLQIQMNQENLIKFDAQVFDRQQKIAAFKKSIESTLNLLRTLQRLEST